MSPDPVEHVLVTYLEMLKPPAGASRPAPPTVAIDDVSRTLTPEAYLVLYRAVGGPYGWDKRLKMTPDALATHLAAHTTLILRLQVNSVDAGFCEIDVGDGRNAELCNFGLLPAFQGRGLGPLLLDAALRAAWSRDIDRIWLHTDTEDHPAAVRTYLSAGFRIFRQAMEDPTDM